MSPHRTIKSGHHPDYFLFSVVLLLVVLGLVILASASSDLGKIRFNDSYYYLKHQILSGFLPGLAGFLFALFIHYQRFRKFAFAFLIANLILLVLVFTPLGITQGGASRWLHLGPVTFQPAELLKITYVLYLAAWLANPRQNRAGRVGEGLVPFFVISGIIAALLLVQPATSIVIILLVTGGIIYFLSGARLSHILLAAVLAVLAIAVIIWSSPYRLQRIMTFLDRSQDTHGAAYQINQSLIAIGSGGLSGVGYGQSTSKVSYLPAPLDDSIFAIAAQELGFIGASAIVTLFGLLVFRMLWIARRLRDRFGQLILIGFGSIIALQSTVNMGAISGLIPLTGVPLPFVSFGGTSLAVFLLMSGIALNISKYD
jgi:cell division protein FtsW